MFAQRDAGERDTITRDPHKLTLLASFHLARVERDLLNLLLDRRLSGFAPLAHAPLFTISYDFQSPRDVNHVVS
jgi:hypothetical protein